MQEIRPKTLCLTVDMPCDVELEKTLLGALLYKNTLIPEAEQILTPDCFFEELHGKIFKKIIQDYYSHGNVDVANITCFLFTGLKLSPEIEECRDIVNEMYISGCNTENVKAHVNKINEFYKVRVFLQSLHSTASLFSSIQEKEDDGWQVDGLISLGEQQIIQSRPISSSLSCKDISNAVREWQGQKLTYQNRKISRGLYTGFKNLDNLIKGLQKSQLIIIAGRTSMGKTAFALNILLNVCSRASRESGGVALFSLEMSNNELISRCVSMISRRNLSDLASSCLSCKEIPYINTAVNHLKKLNFFLDDSPYLNFTELRSRCLRLVKHHNVKCVCIDYLQLIKPDPGMSSSYRTGFITQLTANLKALARELDIPIIVLSQLSRAPESRAGRRPELSDLRDSGTIEQDADVVMFIYRQGYYEAMKAKPEKGSPDYEEWKVGMEKNANQASVIVAKNRNGPLGETDLRFIPENVKFENLEGEEEHE